MADVNTRVLLTERPTGLPTLDHFVLDTEPLPELEAGQVRETTEALGIDAFIATTLTESGFHQRTEVGGVVTALGVGVRRRDDQDHAVGRCASDPPRPVDDPFTTGEHLVLLRATESPTRRASK